MNNTNIKKSIILVGLEKFSLVFFQFFTSVILARLLMPDDFGTVAMLSIFIATADTLIDGGFGGSLIYYTDVDKRDYSTIFWINLTISCLLYLLIIITSPLIASFYETPILEDLIKVLGMVVVFQSFGLIQYTQLYKNLEYKKLLYVSLISYTCSAIIAVVLAFMGLGVWALVAQQVAHTFIRTCILMLYNRFIPSLYFSCSLVKKHWNFGSGLFFSSLTRIVYDNMYIQLIGKYCSITDTGYYNQAKKLKDIPTNLFAKTFETVIFPVFSKFEDDILLSHKYRELNLIFASVSVPLFLLIAISSKEIVNILLGSKWDYSSTILTWISVGAIFYVFEIINRTTLKAKGKTILIFRIDLIKRLFSILLMFILIKTYGLYGIVFSFCFNGFVGWLVNVWFNSKFFSYSFGLQFADVMKYFVLGAIVGILTSIICFSFDTLSFVVTLLVKTILYVLMYTLILGLLRDKSLLYFIKMLKIRSVNSNF